MCGIVGYVDPSIGPEAGHALLSAMTDRLTHRGPDAGGLAVAPGFGFGHRRLSIVGLADGAQPMESADGALLLTFNGEIFNHVELRRMLETLGHRFRTRSDTEVILHLYARYGEACLDHMNGDFAFALYDRRSRRLFAARDRMGVRPFFYVLRPQGLGFASEIKALLALPGFEAQLDPLALDQIFTLWAPVPPRTIFRDVLELPAGHCLRFDACGTLTVRRYYDLAFPDAAAARGETLDEGEAAEELLALLTDATAIRLRADVPVGAYLSGGLDSAIVAALARPLLDTRLRTYSVTFDSAEHDESAEQQAMVRHLGTAHTAVSCPTEEIGTLFSAVIRHAEKPLIRTAPAPLYRLAARVRADGMKVVLTGEGADEVFAGYDLFKEAKIRRFVAADPGSTRRPLLFRRLYPYLPGIGQQTAESLTAFFGGDADPADPLFSHRPRLKSTAGTRMFFSGDLKALIGDHDATAELVARLPAEFAGWHPQHQAQYLESRFLLPDYILSSQGDRMAMAHGVEGRFPFLDHRLVAFAARLPPRLTLKGLVEKHILRRAAGHLLPPAIAARTKQPYRAPESRSFFGPAMLAEVARRFTPQALEAQGLFQPQAGARLFEKCRRGADGFRDNAAFVAIYSTALWHDHFAGPVAARTPVAAAL